MIEGKDLKPWLANFLIKIEMHGPNLGLNEKDISIINQLGFDLIRLTEEVSMIRSDFHNYIMQKESQRKNAIEILERNISVLKSKFAYTTDLGMDLGIEDLLSNSRHGR